MTSNESNIGGGGDKIENSGEKNRRIKYKTTAAAAANVHHFCEKWTSAALIPHRYTGSKIILNGVNVAKIYRTWWNGCIQWHGNCIFVGIKS